MTYIASFDIGKKNFSFYIEKFNKDDFKELINISKKDRYHINGTCKEDFSTLLKKVYCNGEKILLKNVDITDGTDKNKYFDSDLCHNLNDVLDQYKEYWDKVEYFIVEQQMSFNAKINTMALKIGQHCESYFMIKYGRVKKVIEFPSYHKTQVLGSEKIEKVTKTGKKSYKNIDKPARKKWSIETAYGILTEREDFETIEEITKSKKKDDLSDVIIQAQAFKYLYFIDNFIKF
jgi:hypothetical protein